MSLDLSGIKKDYVEVPADNSQGTILSLMAERHPYVFIVASVTGDDNERLVLKLDTNIPRQDQRVLRTVLQGVLETLPELDDDSSE